MVPLAYGVDMALVIRTITDGEVDALRDALMTTFGFDEGDVDPGGAARLRALIDTEQIWAAFDGAAIVATAATFNLELGVPGGHTLPMAGLTMVTVRPTHRRRGLLRELIARHLEDARIRGLPASGLWSSEASIYGRFGYGVAADHHDVTVTDAHSVSVAGPHTAATLGELDLVSWIDEAQARVVLPDIYRRATAQRPGALRRTATWWHERRFLETPFMRGGASRRRHVVARRGDELVGYVVYRQRPGSLGALPTGKAEIIELFGLDARAEATLWRYMLALDLFPTVSWWNAPTDDPLSWLVDNPRRVERRRVDNLWLRIEDVATALTTRGYTSEGTLRFALEDTTWELVASDGRALCAPTSGPAELELGRSTLGALYLGGASASQLARAGLVRGEAAAIARADHLFASAIAPWCAEIF